MGNGKKPNINLILNREKYNYLITVFDYFLTMEKEIGSNYFSERSEQLKEKIMKYSYIFDDEEDKNISIYFFKSEVIILLNILIFYIGIFSRQEPIDYFSELESQKKSSGALSLLNGRLLDK